MAGRFEKNAPEDSATISILQWIWRFTNESQIISAVIISLMAVLGTQLIRIYTYIYWLPYFTFFNISLEYYETALFDNYSRFFEVLPKVLVFAVVLFAVNWIFKRNRLVERYGYLKVSVFSTVTSFLCLTLSTALARKAPLPEWLAAIPFEIRSQTWIYISSALMLIVAKIFLNRPFIRVSYRPKFTAKIAICIFLIVIILLGVGIMVYIQGYNDNTVDFLVGDLEIIDGDKLILFETTDQYYIIPCKKNEDGSLTILMKYYAFVDKNEQLVHREYYADIYNDFGVKMN